MDGMTLQVMRVQPTENPGLLFKSLEVRIDQQNTTHTVLCIE